MKHLAFLAFLAPLALTAQSLVDQLPHHRTVLLEEFTGIQNLYAPEAHTSSEMVAMQHPDSVVIVRMHAGWFAIPQDDGQPDLRNTWSEDLFQHFEVVFTPIGLVGRSPLFQSTLITMGSWGTATEAVLFQSSPVNLGVASAFDPGTRELTITVELYYTGAPGDSSDYIHVLLTEDGIIGYQLDAAFTPPAIENYEHRHALRAYITDLWGDEVAEPAMGSSVIRTYVYTLPAYINVDNCNVVAFVGKYQGEVQQVKEVNANGGTTEVGMSEVDSEGLLAPAYPQPANALLLIPTPWPHEQFGMVVLDATGRTRLLERKLQTNLAVVDVSGWPSGIYICRFVNGGMVRSQRIIVSH